MSFTREDGTRYKGWNLYHTGTMWEAYTYPTGEIITANTHADLRREIDTRDLFARVDAALARAESR